MKAVEIKNVTYAYPTCTKSTLQNLTLNIDPGDFVGVIGLTGSGKTTLFRLINGLIPHYFNGKIDGEVYVDNLKTVEHAIGELATHVGTVFQEADSQLFFQTVEDDVAFGPENLCRPPQEIAQTVNQVLTKTGLSELRQKSPNNLSEGQKQLVAVASVLAMKPQTLLLDEPTANLDAQGSEKVMELLQEVNQEGITVILASHELDLLAEYARRIVVVKDGQIKADGKPDEIFADPRLAGWGFVAPQTVQLTQKLQANCANMTKCPVTVAETFEWIVRRLNA